MNRQSAEAAKLPEPDFALDEMALVVVDAAVEVHRVLGPGLLESVYEQALSIERGACAPKRSVCPAGACCGYIQERRDR